MTEPQLSAEMEKRFDKEFGYLSVAIDYYVENAYPLRKESGMKHLRDIKHFLATALEEQRATFVDEVKNRKATIKWLWGKQRTDDECFLMVMEQVQKIADILNGKE